MSKETLNKLLALSEKLGHVFVATADASGLPHIAAAGKIHLAPDGRLEIQSWFCPGTVDNLSVNSNMTLVVWDAKTDTGYQLVGKCEKVEELHILDGYVPEIENKSPVPQIERKLIFRLDKIIDFKHAPHTDIEN